MYKGNSARSCALPAFVSVSTEQIASAQAADGSLMVVRLPCPATAEPAWVSGRAGLGLGPLDHPCTEQYNDPDVICRPVGGSVIAGFPSPFIMVAEE